MKKTIVYCMMAMSIAMLSCGSDLVSPVKEVLDPPAAPGGLTLNTITGSSATLSWQSTTDTGTTNTLDGYNVYWSHTSGGNYQLAETTDLTSTTTTITGLQGNAKYYFVVRTLDRLARESKRSNEVSGIALNNPPPAPSGLTLGTVTHNSIALSWTAVTESDNGDSVAGYHVYLSTTAGAGYLLAATSATTSCTVTPLNSSTLYYFIVKAYDAVGSLEGGASAEVSATTAFQNTVAAPVCTPAGANYTTSQNVTITSTTPGAAIRYTTDGSTPTAVTGTLYTGPIAIINAATIKAIATLAGYQESTVTSDAYTITGTVGTPIFSLATSTFANDQTVTISCATPGATIKYTIDGSDPSRTAGLTYAAPISITATTLLKARAFVSGWQTDSDSIIQSATYTLQTNNVVFNPLPVLSTTPKSITMSTLTAGATIRYTINGSAPTAGSGTVYTGPVLLSSNSVLQAIAYKAGYSDSSITAGSYTITGTVDTPAFSIPGGTYPDAQNVTISCATPGATIRFTTDGSSPSRLNGTDYTVPVNITANTQLKARAYVPGWLTDSDSVVQAQTYLLQTGKPVCTPATTYFATQVVVTISSATPGATIHYTTDGTPPSQGSGTPYTGPITITGDTTLKAIAFKAPYPDSPVVTENYTVTGMVANPTFSLPSGTYYNDQSVTISCATPGATIKYTIDGSTPSRTNGIEYTATIPIQRSTILQAIAYMPAWQPDSDSAVQGISCFMQTLNVVLNPAGNFYTDTQTVTMNCLTSGATIRFTKDGTTPTANYGTIYAGPINVGKNMNVKAIAYKTGYTDSIVESQQYTITVKEPTFTPAGGEYFSSVNVALATTTTGASIRYTTDGSVPTPTYGSLYAAPVFITYSSTLRAIAYKTGCNNSLPVSSTYTFTGYVADPVISSATGIYNNDFNVTITCGTPGSTIMYTTDGSDPSRGVGTPYTGPIAITTTTTLKAMAFVAAYALASDTGVVSSTYTMQVAQPFFDPPAGEQNNYINVTIGSLTAGTTIRYTTDGSIPTAGYGDFYTGPFPLSANTTVKAIAYRTNYNNSSVASGAFFFVAGMPNISPDGGKVLDVMPVSMTSATSGAEIRYTTDGSEPTPASLLYTAPLPINASGTFKARAFRAGFTDSATRASTFTLVYLSMVKDINPNSQGSNPNSIAVMNGWIYFGANSDLYGFELFKTDGTAANTVLVKDIRPGTDSSYPYQITAGNGNIFFQADNGTNGYELWVSDGTGPGTYQVKDIYPGMNGSGPNNFRNLNGQIIFTAYNDMNGSELWTSDGTEAGTSLLIDIYPGTYSSSPQYLTVAAGKLYFSANDPLYGTELWTSDGSAAGTCMVKDIYPGLSGSSIQYITDNGSTLYFTANDGISGYELWTSDGTDAGTIMVKDIFPGFGSSYPSSLKASNGHLCFYANDGLSGYEPWMSDGTPAGTILLKDIYPGIDSSSPYNFTDVNGTVFFYANDGFYGSELWKSDGTPAGTAMVKDIWPGINGSNPNFFTNANGVLYFTASDGTNGCELWKSDGTDAGTFMLSDINPGSAGSFPSNMIYENGILYFSADNCISGNEIWKSDGTTSGTVMVEDINMATGDSFPNSLADVNGELFFSANDGFNGHELWKSNGTAAGTVMVKDIFPGPNGGNPYFITNVGGKTFFTAYNDTTGNEYWTSDGTSAGTVILKDINPGPGGQPSFAPVSFNGSLYFPGNDNIYGVELWKSDGTTNGTVFLKDIYPGNTSAYPSYLTIMDGFLYFSATDNFYGTELWKTDGTANGTEMVKDIYPGMNGSGSYNITNINGVLLFCAYDNLYGNELWMSDGTAAGTVMIKDICSGSCSSSPSCFITMNGKVYFTAMDNFSGSELWVSDGTAAGTMMVQDIYPGSNSSSPSNLTNLNGVLYFSANNGINGSELWRSDGTAGDTSLVKDIAPGLDGSNPSGFALLDNCIYFNAYSTTMGSELWVTDGTGAGTVLAEELYPGLNSSSPTSLTISNSMLYFQARTNTMGAELFVIK